MTRFTKKCAAAVLASYCSVSHAYSPQEVWGIEAIGFPTQQNITTKVTKVNTDFLVDATVLLELGFSPSKIQIGKTYNLKDLGRVTVIENDSLIRLNVAEEYLPSTVFNMGRRAEDTTQIAQPISGLLVNYDAHLTTEKTGRQMVLLDSSYYVAGKYKFSVQSTISKEPQSSGIAVRKTYANISYADPIKAYSWTLGDALSSNGEGINPVNFAGIQFMKDYALQPGFVMQPVSELKGSAALPSTLDVYLDNRKVLSNTIPAGPFAIENILPDVGATNARIVIRDEFGNERIITQSLLGAAGLLRPGYNNYAVQMGKLRTGLTSLGNVFASGFYSYGLNNALTLEVNAETSERSERFEAVQHVGGALFTATPWGAFSARGRIGTGRSTTMAYSNSWRNGNKLAMFNTSTTRNSVDYRILGSLLPQPRHVKTLQGAFQWAAGKSATLYSLSSDKTSSTGLSLLLSPTLPYKPSYMLSFDKTSNAGRHSSSMALSINIPFNYSARQRSQYVSATLRNQRNQGFLKSVDFTNSTTTQVGNNYHLRAETAPSYRSLNADFSKMTYKGDAHLSVSSYNGTTDARGNMRGALVFDGGAVSATSWVTGGYAKVQADVSNVDILVNGSKQGRTDANGVAYVPIMSTYTSTSLRLDAETEAAIDVTPVEVAVKPHAGALIHFKRITGTFVAIKGVSAGALTVNGQVYPITDRGAYMELGAGQYRGKTSDGRVIEFVIPKPGKEVTQYVIIE